MKKVFPRFDAILDLPKGKVDNMELTLVLRMGMRQINPAADAADGTYHDYGPHSTTGRDRKIIKWTDGAWSAYKRKFEREVQNFWSNTFFLLNPSDYFAFENKGKLYAPHTVCRLDLQINDGQAASNHHNIEVVRLHSSESFFGSHSKLYDSNDIKSTTKAWDSNSDPVKQKAHVHEVGHLLGLGHVNEGTAACPDGPGDDTNATACYGVTDTELNSVMGSGMKPRLSNASPWQSAIRSFCSAAKYKSLRTAASLVAPAMGPGATFLTDVVTPSLFLATSPTWEARFAEPKPQALN